MGAVQFCMVVSWHVYTAGQIPLKHIFSGGSVVLWNEHGPSSQELPRCHFGSSVVWFGLVHRVTEPPCVSVSQKDNSSQCDTGDPRASPGVGEDQSPDVAPRVTNTNKDCGGMDWRCFSILTSGGFGLGSAWIRNDASDMILCRSSWSKLRSSMTTLLQLVPRPSNEQTFLERPSELCRSLMKWKSQQEAVLTFSSGI